MRHLSTLLALIPLTFANAQKPVDEVVYLTILDSLVTCNEFDFYYPHLKHIETHAYSENPLDSLLVFNPETYEDEKISALDFVIESDSINIQEARLFKQRVHFPDGLYIISRIQSSQLHKHKTLQDYIELESYPEIHKLKELSGAIMKKGSLGPYATKPSNKENVEIYKYAIKAHLAFSGVLWDKTNKYCLVECGFHYRISDESRGLGPSGGGLLVLMKNENGIPRIIKFIVLWEE